MKKFFANIKNKATEMAVRAKTAIENVKAEGYVDSGVKILIAVVIGALLLSLLYALFSKTIMPTVTAKIRELFNYQPLPDGAGEMAPIRGEYYNLGETNNES